MREMERIERELSTSGGMERGGEGENEREGEREREGGRERGGGGERERERGGRG